MTARPMAEQFPERNNANINLSWANISATGMRASNQDAMGEAQQDDMVCFVMSDGAGGHEGGEVAARIVVDTVLSEFLRESSFGVRAMHSYAECAMARVAQGKHLAPRQHDMSATIATVLIDQSNRQALWAHLGDTRIYLFRHDKLHRVTKDHSVAQQFIDAGYGQADQLRLHPQRNILFAAVGAEGGTEAAVTSEAVKIEDGDAFLVCTDGFWEWVLEADMEATLAAARTSQEWLIAMGRIADANVNAAQKLRDNYSVFAIWVIEPAAAGSPMCPDAFDPIRKK